MVKSQVSSDTLRRGPGGEHREVLHHVLARRDQPRARLAGPTLEPAVHDAHVASLIVVLTVPRFDRWGSLPLPCDRFGPRGRVPHGPAGTCRAPRGHRGRRGCELLAVLPPRRRRRAAAVRRRACVRALGHHRPGSVHPADRQLLARVRSRSARRPALRLSGHGPGPARATGCASTRARSLLDPYARAVIDDDYDRARAVDPWRLEPGSGHDRRGGRSDHLRLGRRRAAAPSLPGRGHLRAARPRLHQPPQLRSGPRHPRHLPRRGGEDPLPPAPGHRGGRAAARLPVRPPVGARRTTELLGLRAGGLPGAAPGLQLEPGRRPARWTSSATWCGPSTRQASRWSSTWCSTTRPRTASAGRPCRCGGSTTPPTTCSTRPTVPGTWTTAGWATPSTPTTPSCAG